MCSRFEYPYDSLVYVSNLEMSRELNNRAARVCELHPRADGRVGIQMLIDGKKVWARTHNITLILNAEILKDEPFRNMIETEKTDALMYLMAMQGSTPVPGVKASCVNVMTSAEPPPPPPVICGRCKRPPENISEYITGARDIGTTPSKFVMREDGTFDRATGIFFCTDCYITLGCPPGKAYYVREHVNLLTEEDKARLLHAGQWGGRSSRSHWANLCYEIKGRTGEYPVDWAELIVDGRLFSDAGQAVVSGMRIFGEDELADFFGM